MRRGVVVLLLALLLTECATVGRRASIMYVAIAAQLAPDKVRVVINRDFLETYKNRVTIDVHFTVDASSGSPNPPSFDGDLHFAGRAPEIGLRVVAEIKNAAQVDGAVERVQRAAATHEAVKMTGVWRIWPEHSLGAREEQGRPVPALETEYPDHVFEIHPVMRLGEISLLESLHPVEGYRPGSARRTFDIYESATCTITPTPTTLIFTASTWLYNDIHFIMELTDAPQVIVPDGRFVTVRALDAEGKVAVERLRLVFVKGTAPERAVRFLKPGARLHVAGLPRISFAELSRRAEGSRTNPELLSGKLPYEIVVVGIYPDDK